MQYCSLQHRNLLPLLVPSTTGWCFCFGSIPSFFLELFLHWSPVANWAPSVLGSFSFSIVSFCLFILFMGFSRQEYWSGLPFPSPVDHILSDLSIMTHLSCVAPRGMAQFHWVRQGCGPCDQIGRFLWLWFSVSALWCPLTTPTILLGFLLPWTWGVSSWLLQQSSAAAPYLSLVEHDLVTKPPPPWLTE